ncbi:schwannomin-interacting protein 1 homolog [Onthophagus taurus]|uniref:schwannomin-interacting protein 1 homolog n=1 Tax=Onthophagus taurus TaxID=166361 RepID=UPI000C2045D3|nr:schwannomin-interacting protein 1 homolog [Onthophagus taurus]XP_022918765.1 schwannomin-interacting protein 1 homolog [Onthophagus taurus]
MRLKNVDGPLSVHNGNSALLNSPKRINTVQNSNVSTTLTTITSGQYNANVNSNVNQYIVNDNSNVLITNTKGDTNLLNNIGINEDTRVQWCNAAHAQIRTEIANNVNDNRKRQHQLFNINNTLAVSLENTRRATASSICSESSPDDSLLDYEDAHQSCSSVDTSPQEEDRGFDVSDSESISDDINLSQNETNFQRRGIVNPNYPGFQHLAHTLEYGIKASSDTDLTDDDFDCEAESKYVVDSNNANNNNNNNNNNDEEETEYHGDKIDSVNRLDSVENIQKVFYDKTVLNIPLESQSGEPSTSNSNQISDDDDNSPKIEIKEEEKVYNKDNGIIGDLEKEIVQELDRIGIGPDSPIERVVKEELEEAVERLSLAKDLEPTASKYNYEPNVEEPFNKEPPKMLTVLPNNFEHNLTIKDIKILQEDNFKMKLSDAFLSEVQDLIPPVDQEMFADTNLNEEKDVMEVDLDKSKMFNNDLVKGDAIWENEERALRGKHQKFSLNQNEELEKFCKEDKTKDEPEKDEDSAIPRKKEKVEVTFRKKRDYNQQIGSLITIPRRELGCSRGRENLNRRSVPLAREKKRTNPELLGSFDVYNIETAMPKIDLEAIELHLRAAREEERRRRTDREEIRRRLAMGSEDEYYNDRPGRKPSLQSRLQSGMNLQICFMNDTMSDTESPSSDSECTMTNPKQQKSKTIINANQNVDEEKIPPPIRPATLSIGQPLLQPITQPMTETDFFARQARLQTEARMALAQAKEMARMQMEIERQKQKKSPITEMVRHSLEKVGIPFPEDRRRLSRQILTEMNVAQLQVIVNDLHTQIETLNENLVKFLMERDDLHMEQDSMLVDIEDLTRYLGAKEQSLKDQNQSTIQNNNIPPPSPAPSSPLAALNSSMKPHLHRIASLVKK